MRLLNGFACRGAYYGDGFSCLYKGLVGYLGHAYDAARVSRTSSAAFQTHTQEKNGRAQMNAPRTEPSGVR
eukprot:4867317-Pyramimonas_sp.AAC.1